MKFYVRIWNNILDNRRTYILFIVFILLAAFCLINPVSASTSPESANIFGEQHMTALMNIDLNVTIPEPDSILGLEAGSQIISVVFPFMLEPEESEADTEGGDQHGDNELVTPMFAQSKLTEFNPMPADMPIYRAQTWWNDTTNTTYQTTENITQASQASVLTTGYKYSAIIPSPAQLAFYVCWKLGYTLNNITNANMTYETGSRTGQRAQYIIECRTANITVDTDLTDGSIDAGLEESDYASNLPETALTPVKMPIGFEIVGSEEADFTISTLIICVTLIIIAVIAYLTIPPIVHDLTGHAAQDELAEAYTNGFEGGADDQMSADRDSIFQAYLDGNITAEQCQALLNEVDQNNDRVKATFTNPYAVGSYNQWSRVTIGVMGFIILIVIIIVVIIVALCFYYYFKRKSKSVDINVKTGGVHNV